MPHIAQVRGCCCCLLTLLLLDHGQSASAGFCCTGMPFPAAAALQVSVEVQQAAKEEVLHDGELGQHLHLVHLYHATVHLQELQEMLIIHPLAKH